LSTDDDEGTAERRNKRFTSAHELALTKEIMGGLGRYCQDEHIDLCPLCLRDTMLASRTLHLEAATVADRKVRKPSLGVSASLRNFLTLPANG